MAVRHEARKCILGGKNVGFLCHFPQFVFHGKLVEPADPGFYLHTPPAPKAESHNKNLNNLKFTFGWLK